MGNVMEVSTNERLKRLGIKKTQLNNNPVPVYALNKDGKEIFRGRLVDINSFLKTLEEA